MTVCSSNNNNNNNINRAAAVISQQKHLHRVAGVCCGCVLRVCAVLQFQWQHEAVVKTTTLTLSHTATSDPPSRTGSTRAER